MLWDILIIAALALGGGYFIYWFLVGREAVGAPEEAER